MQRCTKVPMMLASIRQHTDDTDGRKLLDDALDKLEESLSKRDPQTRGIYAYAAAADVLPHYAVCVFNRSVIFVKFRKVK